MRVERFLLGKGQEVTKHTVVLFRQASWVELRYLAIIQRPHDGRRRQSILHPLLTHALVLFPIFLLTRLAAVPGRVTLDTFVRTGPHPTSVARTLEGDRVVEWHVSSGTKMHRDTILAREGVVRCLVARGAYLSARWGSGHAQAEGTHGAAAKSASRPLCVAAAGRSRSGRLVVASAFMVYVRTIPYKDCAVAFLVLPKRHCPRHASLLSLIDSPAGCSGRGRACGSTRIVPYPREPAPAPRVNQKNNDDLPQSFSSAQGHRQYQ